MLKGVLSLIVLMLIGSGTAEAVNWLEKAKELTGDKQAGSKNSEPDKDTVAAGLKEALSVGTGNAVSAVSKTDGYFKNPAIRIPLPQQVASVEKPLRKFGFSKQLDEFLESMNRAAEKAAPVAKDIFLGAVRNMTIVDAYGILRGGDTAATDYLKSKTYRLLYDAFKPSVSRAVMEVGVTRSYQNLVGKTKKTGLVKDESLDLDHHVTSKALDGLFYMLGKEEQKIRKDPAAQVTSLLKQVFGKR